MENTPPTASSEGSAGAEWVAAVEAARRCARELSQKDPRGGGGGVFEEDAEAAEALANCMQNHQVGGMVQAELACPRGLKRSRFSIT